MALHERYIAYFQSNVKVNGLKKRDSQETEKQKKGKMRVYMYAWRLMFCTCITTFIQRDLCCDYACTCILFTYLYLFVLLKELNHRSITSLHQFYRLELISSSEPSSTTVFNKIDRAWMNIALPKSES